MDKKKKALQAHEQWAGKFEIKPRATVRNKEELAVAYTPGVAEPCLAIQQDIENSYKYTRRHNLVLVVTDGSAVLGLGDIGPEAGMPVMEGKCVLFKEFADVDAFPLCIRSKDVEEIVNTISLISGSFGGINLEDISAPRCFEIERRLEEVCDIPVFHDDQHGTAIVVVAGLLNALTIVEKNPEDIKVVMSGAGAASTAVSKLLLTLGVKDITLSDRYGILHQGRERLSQEQRRMLEDIGYKRNSGVLADAMKGADVLIGLSAPGLVTPEMVASMNSDSIVFAMANPVPEIFPEQAKQGGARVVGTGRSDFPNQINNVLAFPGVFRGVLDVRASRVSSTMNLAAAKAIAALVTPEELQEEYIIPDAFHPEVAKAVSQAVAKAAISEGLARQVE